MIEGLGRHVIIHPWRRGLSLTIKHILRSMIKPSQLLNLELRDPCCRWPLLLLAHLKHIDGRRRVPIIGIHS
jgi:hypothetical protein